jgi:hypothetical protein
MCKADQMIREITETCESKKRKTTELQKRKAKARRGIEDYKTMREIDMLYNEWDAQPERS